MTVSLLVKQNFGWQLILMMWSNAIVNYQMVNICKMEADNGNDYDDVEERNTMPSTLGASISSDSIRVVDRFETNKV